MDILPVEPIPRSTIELIVDTHSHSQIVDLIIRLRAEKKELQDYIKYLHEKETKERKFFYLFYDVYEMVRNERKQNK